MGDPSLHIPLLPRPLGPGAKSRKGHACLTENSQAQPAAPSPSGQALGLQPQTLPRGAGRSTTVRRHRKTARAGRS